MHYTLSRTTLKNIIHIYCYLQIADVNNLASQSSAFIISFNLPQIHIIFSLLYLPTTPKKKKCVGQTICNTILPTHVNIFFVWIKNFIYTFLSFAYTKMCG